MRKSKAKLGDKIYLMKAILSDWSGKVRGHPYRVIAVPERFTLYRLAEAIVDGFGFYFDHPFGFYDNIKQWSKSNEGYELFADIGEESEFNGVERTKVGKVFDEMNKCEGSCGRVEQSDIACGEAFSKKQRLVFPKAVPTRLKRLVMLKKTKGFL